MAEQREFITFLNGEVMPHSQAVAILERSGLQTAGGYYDAERTFGGEVFKLRQHIERMFNGLNYSGIDPGMNVDGMETVTRELLKVNRRLLNEGEEFTITQTVSLGRSSEKEDQLAVNVIIYFQILDTSAFALSYTDGVRVVTPATYGVSEQSAEANPKSGRVYPLMTNSEGIITECKGANFMFVRDGRIKLPDRTGVLPGVSMQTVLEIAEGLDIPVDEGEYSPYDVYMADEAFVSSTRYCMLPVATLNGYRLGEDLPGPRSRRILDAWRELVGMDFVQQAIDSLPPNT